MCRKTLLICVGVLLCSTRCFAADPDKAAADRNLKKIVFIAGPKDHGGPGAHEYQKDLLLLKKCLDNSPNVKGITTEIFVAGRQKDVGQLKDAATIVIHSSGDRLEKETHAIFPNHHAKEPDSTFSAADEQYIQRLDGLMKQGMGMVVLHYSLIVENPRSAAYLLDWIGGYHRSGQSRVKIDRSEARPAKPGHPILHGVRPWTTDHEYYFNQYFRENDQRFVPLLTSMLPSDDPQRHVIAWAVERQGGGRGFGFTGGHYHRNMRVENYRRMILNAVLWTAKVPIPPEGVVSSVAGD